MAKAEPMPGKLTTGPVPPVCVDVDAVLELVEVVLPLTDVVGLVLTPVELDGDPEVLVPEGRPDTLMAAQAALVLGDCWSYGR
jgi:hypothetical protein